MVVMSLSIQDLDCLSDEYILSLYTNHLLSSPCDKNDFEILWHQRERVEMMIRETENMLETLSKL